MKITGGTIVGYSLGLPALVIGIIVLVLAPFVDYGGTWFGIFGLAALVSGIVLTPVTRRLLKTKAGVELNRGAVAGIVAGSLIIGVIATGGFALAAWNQANDGAEGGNDVDVEGDSGPGADVPDISLDTDPESVESESYSLGVRYNYRAQSGIDPDSDDMTSYQADDGQKFVVVRLEITNTGEDDIDLDKRLFRLETDGVVRDPQNFWGAGGGLDVTLRPNGTARGWIVFTVDFDTAESTLTTDSENAYYNTPVYVEFEHDPEMLINMDD